jgi:hypothetical protein
MYHRRPAGDLQRRTASLIERLYLDHEFQKEHLESTGLQVGGDCLEVKEEKATLRV